MKLEKLVAAFDPSLAIERAWTPPGAWYVDEDLYRLEQRAIFARTWTPLCRLDEVKDRGDFVSGMIGEEPVVVVRGEDDKVRAFSNVCRHKGREVVVGCGKSPLVCGYHGWRYDADGRLKSAPKMAGIEDFDRETMSLPRLRAEIWGPWVWVNLDDDTLPFASQVAPLLAGLEESHWRQARYHSSANWEIACNWKVYVDNYLDGGYHIPHMHPSLDAQLDMESYRTELFERFNMQTSAAGDDDKGARIGGGAIYAWLYPSFMINRYGACFDTNHVVPTGPHSCRVNYEFFFAPGVSDADIATSIEQSAVTQREDIEICESVQRGVRSSRYDRGRYAPRLEIGEHHFHGLLAADYIRQITLAASPRAQ